MKILITGCLGFIGFSYIKKFSKLNNIVGVDFYKISEKNKMERLKYLNKKRLIVKFIILISKIKKILIQLKKKVLI